MCNNQSTNRSADMSLTEKVNYTFLDHNLFAKLRQSKTDKSNTLRQYISQTLHPLSKRTI